MSEPRPPLRTMLRDPADPARVRALWTKISARRVGAEVGPQALTSGWGWLVPSAQMLRGSAVALLCATLATSIWLGTAGHEPTARTTGIASPPAMEALRLRHGQPLTAVETGPDQLHTIELSDGTRIAIAGGSRLVPRVSRPAELELSLERGRARFDVQPQAARRFVVTAGELTVEVVGTSFTVERTLEAVSVRVEHGRVRVRHPGLPGGMSSLGAGDSLRWPSPPDEAATEVEASLEPDSPPSESTRLAAPLPPGTAWRALAGQGEYARAYALLGENGYARAVADARSAEELLLLADMARSVSAPAEAARALEVLVKRHPRDGRAPLAALTLGRLQLDALGHPETACETFQRAIDLGLPAALQEDALARRIEACARAGQSSVAWRDAAEYRRRFPEGRWRARVDIWTGAP